MRALLLIALAGCSSSEPSLVSARLATLEYRVPDGWVSRDRSTIQRATVEWTPEGDNDRKESLVVSRVESPAFAVERSRPHLKRQLVEANNQLPQASFTPPKAFITQSGLFGLRVDGTFTPPHQVGVYHRTHAVLVEGKTLVHVLFTARDSDRESIEAVLDGFNPGA